LIVAASYIPGPTSSKELIEFVKIFQPYAEKGSQYKELRQKGFSQADPNGNGHSSLAEVEVFINHTLVKAFPLKSPKPDQLFRKFRKSFLYAFNAARSLHASDENDDKEAQEANDAYLTFPEFRMFNAYLCVYAGMLDGFFAIDGTVDEYTDNKIDRAEFVKSFKYVNAHGFSTMVMKTDKEARDLFTAVDADGSGKIAYNEWFEHIAKAESEENTKVGRLLSPNSIALVQ